MYHVSAHGVDERMINVHIIVIIVIIIIIQVEIKTREAFMAVHGACVAIF